ncbi:MAG: hemC [Bacteroidetes bacterium]|jgi:uroporphyrinogen-III synthase|nr:hemC [Bacteroidota bacterium]
MKKRLHSPANNLTIFISKDLKEDNLLLTTLKAKGFEVVHQSLIKISPIRFSYAPKSQWIFFSSKNAITHFFGQNPEIDPGTKFGVMGQSSAAYLEEFGKKADFIGTGTDTAKIAKDFAACIQNDTVLFPQAIDSLQTIQKHLAFNNISSNLYVYKTTLITDFDLPQTDMLVFTSPSNVRAWFAKYKSAEGQIIVAMGTSTLRELNNYGVKEAAMPESFDEEGLLEAILKQVETSLL